MKLCNLAIRFANKRHFAEEVLRARLSNKRPLTILFSPGSVWEPTLRRGFRFTHHRIAFATLSAQSIAAHDVVVPLNIHEQRRLAELRSHATSNVFPIPDAECIELCDDKLRLNEQLAASGFAGDLPRPHLAGTYPYILKKRVDEYGQNSHIVRDASDEETLAQLLSNPDYLCQEFIPGPVEYATHILMKDRRVVCSLNIRYVFRVQNPIKGHDEPLYAGVCPCPHLELFASMLRSIGFEGLCCVNYKLRGRHPLLMEINPRFGGSLATYFFSFMRHLS